METSRPPPQNLAITTAQASKIDAYAVGNIFSFSLGISYRSAILLTLSTLASVFHFILWLHMVNYN